MRLGEQTLQIRTERISALHSLTSKNNMLGACSNARLAVAVSKKKM